MLKKVSLPFLGFLQASGLFLYILLVTTFLNIITKSFNTSTAEYFAPIIMLLIFIISAVISASLVLGKAAVLFWERKYKEAFSLVGWTIGWVFLYFVILLSIVFLV